MFNFFRNALGTDPLGTERVWMVVVRTRFWLEWVVNGPSCKWARLGPSRIRDGPGVGS